jgi:hypothetical protein
MSCHSKLNGDLRKQGRSTLASGAVESHLITSLLVAPTLVPSAPKIFMSVVFLISSQDLFKKLIPTLNVKHLRMPQKLLACCQNSRNKGAR